MATSGDSRDDLTVAQKGILTMIEAYHDEYESWPTYREIAAKVGISSTSQVHSKVQRLKQMGYLTGEPGVARGAALARSAGRGTHRIPILAEIAAGEPLYIRDPEDADVLDISLHSFPAAGDADVYALRVVGDSMVEDGILSGDFVIVLRDVNVENGMTAVAVDLQANGGKGGATVKHVYRADTHIRLQPANPTYEPRIIDAKVWDRDWKVQGKVIATYRRY